MPFIRVRASCPICGAVEIGGSEVTIRPSLEALRNVYAFECPKCASPIVKEADGGIVLLLLHGGAQVGSWPPSPTEPGPITDAELIDFHEWLEQLPTAER